LLREVLRPVGDNAGAGPGPSQPRVILVDGTSLGQTGGSGDEWRVQLAYDLVEGCLVHVQVGDKHQAETLVGLPGQAGDLFVGDRGYGQRSNVIALDGLQAAALLRFSPNHCRLEQADGSLFEISPWLEGLKEEVGIGEQAGYCVQADKRVKVRVLALRLPAEEAEKARARVLARAKRKQQVVRPETLQLAGWVLLLSTLNAHDFRAEELFWLYRHRWQIELLIKQLKQFLLLVRLRSRHPETVRTALLAALLAWALQEQEGQALLCTLEAEVQAGQQSLVQAYLPLLEQWEAEEAEEPAVQEPRRPISIWLLMATCTTRWRMVVLGQWSFARMQACLPRLRRFFCPSPRRRLHQRLWFQAWVQHRLLGGGAQGFFP
jgi:Transposase DDE domain